MKKFIGNWTVVGYPEIPNQDEVYAKDQEMAEGLFRKFFTKQYPNLEMIDLEVREA